MLGKLAAVESFSTSPKENEDAMPEKNALLLEDASVPCSCREQSILLDAESELRSFFRAVTRLYGAGQALQSINDWVEECERLEWPRNGASPEWRRVTIAAAVRLSKRVGRRVC